MRPTIVVVTDRTLFPQRAGNVARIVALLGALRATGHRVVLVAPRVEGRLSPLLPAITRTLRTHLLADRYLPVRAAPFASGRLTYDCSPYLPAVARAVRLYDPVCVIAEYAWMTPCFDAVSNGALMAVDTHDLMHVRRDMYDSIRGGAWVDCTRDEEARMLGRADVVIAIQPHERREFTAMLPERRVVCVPHVCVPVAEPAAAASAPGEIVVFVGSWNDGNRDGLEAFVRDAWPVVRRMRPGAELHVYGDAAGHLRDAGADGVNGVRCLGHTRRLADAYASAAVVVNPIRIGTGLKIKTVEALAFRKAVVTTACGAAGIEHGAGSAFLMEDDMAAFGEAVARLLAVAGARTTLEHAAAAFVSAHFSPHAALRELLAEVDAHGARRRRRAAARPPRRVAATSAEAPHA